MAVSPTEDDAGRKADTGGKVEEKQLVVTLEQKTGYEFLVKFDEGVARCFPQFAVPLGSAAPNLFLAKGRARYGDVAGLGLFQKELRRQVEVQVRIFSRHNADVEHVLRTAPVSQGLLEQCAEFLCHDILELTNLQKVRTCDVNLRDLADWLVETHFEGHRRL